MSTICPCSNNLLGNGNCEVYCNVLACNWDNGDCDESKNPKDITMMLIIILVPLFIVIFVLCLCIVKCLLKRKSSSNRHSVSIVQESDEFISKSSFEKYISFSGYTENLSNDTILICPICLAELQNDENIIITICLHKYHEECMNQWIKSSKKHICPCCMRKI